ncbi:MAG: hypothetical protein QNJ92_00750 [Alphaproteobacteria bacterium]|nr:hypothetical protein [Alphaproteobacteria bacterium]
MFSHSSPWASGVAGSLVGALALALVGCAKEPPTVCPVLGVLETASMVTKFGAGGPQAPENVAYAAEITDADLDCAYTSDTLDEMEVNLRIRMLGRKGPLAAQDAADLEYFVVITDRSGTVVTKKVFPATFEFEGQAQAAITEEIWQYYRLRSGGGGNLYEVWVGFQLSDEETEFNRQQLGS